MDERAPPRIYADRILQRLESTNTSRLANAIRIVPHTSNQEREISSAEHDSPIVGAQENNRPYPSASHLPSFPVEGLDPDSNSDLNFGDFNVILEDDDDDIFNFDKTWVF